MMYLPARPYSEALETIRVRCHNQLINGIMARATATNTVHLNIQLAGTCIRSIQYIGGSWWMQGTNGCVGVKLTVTNAKTITV